MVRSYMNWGGLSAETRETARRTRVVNSDSMKLHPSKAPDARAGRSQSAIQNMTTYSTKARMNFLNRAALVLKIRTCHVAHTTTMGW